MPPSSVGPLAEGAYFHGSSLVLQCVYDVKSDLEAAIRSFQSSDIASASVFEKPLGVPRFLREVCEFIDVGAVAIFESSLQ